MKIYEWANSWFNEPGGELTPKVDRMLLFVATVALLGERSNDARDERDVHDHLEYLLLGCNPITNWTKESEYELDQDSAFYKECHLGLREPLKKLLDYTNPDSGSAMYSLLIQTLKACEQYGSQNVSLVIGERVTMLMLAFFLLDRRIERPTKDIGLIQSCLDLWYSSEKQAIDESRDYEYASMRHDLRYANWLVMNVERLFKMHVETSELKASLAYIGWFASLVRAYRVARVFTSSNESWGNELLEVASNEIVALRSVRYRSELKHHEDQIRDGSSLHAAVRLFRMFKVKPPPVKIR